MILIFVSLLAELIKNKCQMKYSELEKKIKKIGCNDTGKKMNGHPLWYSPITDKYFKMSNHKSEEVKKGTLQSILKDSGLK